MPPGWKYRQGIPEFRQVLPPETRPAPNDHRARRRPAEFNDELRKQLDDLFKRVDFERGLIVNT